MSTIALSENLFETATRDVFVVLSVLLPVMGVNLTPQQISSLTDRLLDEAEYPEIYALVRGSYREINDFVSRRLVPMIDALPADLAEDRS